MATTVGIDAKYFWHTESTFNTAIATVAGDGIPTIECKIEPDYEHHKSKEHTGSASLESEIVGYQKGKWSLSAYARPNAAGTAPDIGEILKAAYGIETVSGGVSVTYSLSGSSLAEPYTGQLVRHAGNYFFEVANGCVVEEVTYEIAGNDEPKISFSGSFAQYGWCYGGTTTATVSAAASTFTLAAADRGKIGVNARIQIGTDDNSGAGYLVTAYNTSTGVVTFSPVLANTQTGATTIVPYTPTPTTSGTIIGGIDAGLTLGSDSLGFISGKVTVKTGNRLLDKEATAVRPSRAARGPREISGEIDAYFLSENSAQKVGKAWESALQSVLLRFGSNTAGSRLKLNFANARVQVTPVELPEAEEATCKFKFLARKSAAANDEHTAVYD